MSSPTILDTFVRGDLFQWDFTLGGDWLMAQFDEMWFTVANAYPSSNVITDTGNSQVTLTGGGITVLGSNKGRVTFAASTTRLWRAARLNCDLQARQVGNSEGIFTLDRCVLPVIPDVTRSM